ncbi:MAG: agmatine deiminase family protein [Rhodospirillales bacterium]|nr:agmatine deiminase family protein [Rhodospirillales bacterium]
MARPVDDGFFMPPEWAPHARCWMQWPCREPLFGEHLAAARDAYADVARAIAEFEPVTMIANPEHVIEASLKCGPGVSTFPLPLDDSWCRDSGPTFVVNMAGAVAGVDWKWNAWGNKYPDHKRDAGVARAVLEHLGMRRYAAPLVLEGGAIHVDGEGTLLTTESCLLNPNRNPDIGREEVEGALRQFLGVRAVIWLNGGLEDDDTDGHVDNVACFARPGLVLGLHSSDPADGNHRVLADNLARLRATKDAAGRDLEVISIEQPRRREMEDGRRLALSYINFYIANGGVVMPAFEDPQDRHAYDAIQRAFPDRRVVQVPATDIVFGGGGIHCITQQQPAGEPAK